MKILFALLYLLSLDVFAYADVTTDNINYNHKTYSVQLNDLAPANGTTDLVTITGTAGKVIRINKLEVGGDATTVGVVDFYAYERTTITSGGTSTYTVPVQHDSLYPISIPIINTGFVIGQSYAISTTSTACNTIGAATNTVGQNFVATGTTASTCVANQSAYASVKLYTANPTLGIGQLIRANHYALPAATSTGYPGMPWVEDFGNRNGQSMVLRGPNESFAFSLNGATPLPAGISLYILIEWTEE